MTFAFRARATRLLARSRRDAAALMIIASGAALLYATAGVARADAPKPEDIAECNREARERDHASGAPNRKDEHSAVDARQPRPESAERTDATGQTTRSPDPQIDGMDAKGAKDAAYRAAYRVCMRKKGF
jgi:hypothetical protein